MDLSKNTFESYAMNIYDNPKCSSFDEFKSDLYRIKYLKKLFRKYYDENDLKERLILNHIIIFFNMFKPKEGCKLLFFSMPEEYHSILKTFLVFTNRMRYDINPVGGVYIDFDDIDIEEEIIEKLRTI